MGGPRSVSKAEFRRSRQRHRRIWSHAPDDAESAQFSDPLQVAVQTHATVLGGVAAGCGVVCHFAASTTDRVRQYKCRGQCRVWHSMSSERIRLAGAWRGRFNRSAKAKLPEAPPLTSAFREAQWGALIAAAGLIGTALEPLSVFWATRLLLVWVVAICAEMLLRLLATVLIPADSTQAQSHRFICYFAKRFSRRPILSPV